ncbi:MAG: putative zinc-binding metallopeptidase [Candidatus Omnitrophica bacterium]|nr:putative zinc-binding metallopeptidase [Candidatus Omnitrophota bacterium]
MPKIQTDLNLLNEAELLKLRICDLPIEISGTWLEECVGQLYNELDAKGLTLFHPECYLADEWLTPVNEPVIGIPFYLSHPALIKLERKMMLEAEGDTKSWCMKLLRHEAGHAICYAYRLNKKRSWQNVFGLSSQDYGDTYRYQPYSKRFVRHLDGYYAQYHPDEDFVETFAVWLTPEVDWKERYKNWKAFDKLNFVDGLMSEIQGKPPVSAQGKKYWNANSLKITLTNFYKKKRELVEEDFPDFHDRQLAKIFKVLNAQDYREYRKRARHDPELMDAGDFLKKHQSHIVYNVARTTGERRYIINDLLKRIIRRCHQLHMILPETQTLAAIQISSYLTSLVMNYIHTGWFRGLRHRRND